MKLPVVLILAGLLLTVCAAAYARGKPRAAGTISPPCAETILLLAAFSWGTQQGGRNG